MSAPVREPRETEKVKTQNPDSLSGNKGKVPRKTPHVRPPFADVSMGRFLTYMVGGLVLLAAFYTWRFTVWAAEVGGYWNLVTGHRNAPSVNPGEAALKAAGSAVSAHRSSATASASGTGKSSGLNHDEDVQSQIYHLANVLGVKPADLSNAIRPLIDPSVPNPAQAAQAELDILKAQLAAGGGAAAANPAAQAEKAEGGSLLAAMGEALLD